MKVEYLLTAEDVGFEPTVTSLPLWFSRPTPSAARQILPSGSRPRQEVSHKLREGPSQWLAEFVATVGLLLTIAGGMRFAPLSTPMLVALYITGAYWFTASTSFANPAVTLARSLTDSFAGIAPSSAPGFILAQIAASFACWPVLAFLFDDNRT